MRIHLFLAACTAAMSGMGQSEGIYVSDAGNFSSPPWKILHYALDGSAPTVYIDEQLAWPQDILFIDSIGQVLVANLNSGVIARHDAVTGDHLGDFATGIDGPTRMKVGPDGLLYVLQWNGPGHVLRYTLDGDPLGAFTSAGVPRSIGLDWDAMGNLYVSSYSADLVQRFDNAGNDLGAFITDDLFGPTNIWFDQDGDLLVSDYDGGAVKRFDPSGLYLGPFITGLGNPEGVAHFADGSFLLGNGTTSSVLHFAADGTNLGVFIAGGSGGLMNPNAIVVRGPSGVGLSEHVQPEGGLYVHPTAGRSFTVRADDAVPVRAITVRSVLGAEVARIGQGTWNADRLAPGTYLVVLQRTDGTVATRRIEVMDR